MTNVYIVQFYKITNKRGSDVPRLSIFIHSDILVLVSVFTVVVVILSEWWLIPTTVGTLKMLPTYISIIWSSSAQNNVCKLVGHSFKIGTLLQTIIGFPIGNVQ